MTDRLSDRSITSRNHDWVVITEWRVLTRAEIIGEEVLSNTNGQRSIKDGTGMVELLTGPLGLVLVLVLWFLLQALILPQLGVRT